MATCLRCGAPLDLMHVVESILAYGELEIGDVRRQVRASIPATDKEIANALAGLVRDRRVKRVKYGVYAPKN